MVTMWSTVNIKWFFMYSMSFIQLGVSGSRKPGHRLLLTELCVLIYYKDYLVRARQHGFKMHNSLFPFIDLCMLGKDATTASDKLLGKMRKCIP